MKEDEERLEEEDWPLFVVHRAGGTTIYEASKGVDWMQLFPDEPGTKPAAAAPVDLPLKPLPLVPTASTGPPDRPTKVYYPRAREERSSWVAIAASIVAILGTAVFIFWLVAPLAVQNRGRSADRKPDERLTMDALAPSTPTPTPSPPRGGWVFVPTPSPSVAPSPKPAAPRATPDAIPTPRTTPTVTPRATPAITPQATPAATPQAAPTAAFMLPQPAAPSPTPPPLTVSSTGSSSASGAAPPVSLSAPPPRTSPTPRPSNTPLSSPSPTPTASSSPAPTPASPTPATSPTAAARTATDTAAVRAVLNNYRAAYESLRAESVKAVWPAANTQALSRAFSQIASQSMDFYTCGIELKAAGAEATCTGAVTFVPKVGSKTPQVESRAWTFYLVRQSDRWIIDRIVSR